jgi:hypothetical protein
MGHNDRKRCRHSGRANERSYGRDPPILLRGGGLRLRLQPALRHCRHCEERQRRSNPRPSKRRHGLLRGACHRVRIRATHWLAMTKTQFHLRRIDPTGKSNVYRTGSVSIPDSKNISLRRSVETALSIPAVPPRFRGAYRDRHERGARDAVDAGGARDERAHFADGEVVWS